MRQDSILTYLAAFLRPASAHAAGPVLPDAGGNSVTQVNGTSVNDILKNLQVNLLNDIFILLGIVAVILLVIAGIQYITSAGDPAKAKTARASILNVVLGIVLLGASYLLIEVITNLAHFFSGKL